MCKAIYNHIYYTRAGYVDCIETFMESSQDGLFRNRRPCTSAEISFYKSAEMKVPSHMPSVNNRIGKASMTRIIKYMSRLNYQHFSQFSTPLVEMSSAEFKAIKESHQQERIERWTDEMLHRIDGRGTAIRPAGKDCIAEE